MADTITRTARHELPALGIQHDSLVLDDPTVLGAHMEKPSVMMLGATMTCDLDDAKGHAIGSVIRITESILGIRLYMEKVVTERLPPLRKTWETRG
ncbi:hypothetical protein NFO65_11495 [Neorhizobium galegae]|uniref:hypothetical protein n=1 Tax=Neorhizobium galegae TaxID=399 RepID=UPI00210166C8|nr:hypothetical protein [Neorhizobium galegae]MCQ1571370.1 hypothetical protein [Neorhizobium galegae]